MGMISLGGCARITVASTLTGPLSMSTISLQDAQDRLAELVANLGPDESVVIMKDNRPVARLVGEPVSPVSPRQLGTMAGTVTYIAADFDAPLDEFREYGL